jgi:hypothetical protein
MDGHGSSFVFQLVDDMTDMAIAVPGKSGLPGASVFPSKYQSLAVSATTERYSNEVSKSRKLCFNADSNETLKQV